MFNGGYKRKPYRKKNSYIFFYNGKSRMKISIDLLEAVFTYSLVQVVTINQGARALIIIDILILANRLQPINMWRSESIFSSVEELPEIA